jgi:hypothetical protein
MVARTLKYFYALPGLAGGALAGVVAVKVLISSEEALSQVRKLGTVPLYISGATLFGLAGAVVMTTMR